MSRKLLLPLILVLAAAPVWAQVGVTTSDECDGAVVALPALAAGATAHDSTGATDSANAFDPTGCNVLGAMSADTWYTYTAPATDTVCSSDGVTPTSWEITISTCVTGFDTDLIVYDLAGGVCTPGTDLTAFQVACDGDGCVGSFASTTTFIPTLGTTYLVRVGQWGGGGTGWIGEINVAEEPFEGLGSGCPLGSGDILLLDWTSNNSVAAAAIDCLGLTGSTTVVTDGAAFDAEIAATAYNTIIIDNPSNLISAAGQAAITAHAAAGGNVFMAYWAMDTADAALLAECGIASGVDFTAVQGLSSGACCIGDSVWNAPNALPGEAVGPAAVDGWFDDGDEFTLGTGTARGEFASGAPALVRNNNVFTLGSVLDGLDTQGGRDLTANCLEELLATGSGPCPLLNDTCATASVVNAGSTSFSNVGAVDEGFGASCMVGPSNDIWFSFTPVCDGDHGIDTNGSLFDTTIAVHEDCLGTEIDCNDDGGVGLTSAVTVPMLAGVTYLIQVSGFGGDTGVGTLTIDASATAPANDDCANALVGLVGPNPFNTICATNDGPLASCGAPTPTDPDVWWTFTASADATVRFDTCASGFDSLLEIYDDCPSAGGTVLACNDDSCGLQSQIDLAMLTGETVTIRLTGFAGASGAGDMTITEILPIDVSGFDIALVNGELGGGALDSHAAHEAALTAAGKTYVVITAGLGVPISGCPNEGWIYNNGTFPDDAPVDAGVMTAIRDCVLGGNGAIVHGGDNWGFAGPTDYDQVDGIDEAASADGGDLVTDLEGVVGTFTEGLTSVYTQDQAGNDWTDVLELAAPGAGTEVMGDNNAFVIFSPAAGYNVGVHYIHDDTIAPGAGDTISMSIEPAGFDDPAAALALCYGQVFGGGPIGDVFSRGDCNNDGGFDIGDPVSALSALFVGGTPTPDCLDACDANDDGGFDIGDPVSFLSSLFVGGSPPPAAPTFPACGVDPTDTDALDCATQPVMACP